MAIDNEIFKQILKMLNIDPVHRYVYASDWRSGCARQESLRAFSHVAVLKPLKGLSLLIFAYVPFSKKLEK